MYTGFRHFSIRKALEVYYVVYFVVILSVFQHLCIEWICRLKNISHDTLKVHWKTAIWNVQFLKEVHIWIEGWVYFVVSIRSVQILSVLGHTEFIADICFLALLQSTKWTLPSSLACMDLDFLMSGWVTEELESNRSQKWVHCTRNPILQVWNLIHNAWFMTVFLWSHKIRGRRVNQV